MYRDIPCGFISEKKNFSIKEKEKRKKRKKEKRNT